MEKLIPILNSTFLVKKDSRLSDLVLTMTWEGQTKSWTHPIQEGVELNLESPVYWQKFDPLAWQELVQIEVRNTAVSGAGKVCCQLGAGGLLTNAKLYLGADGEGALSQLVGWRCEDRKETVRVEEGWSRELRDGEPPFTVSLGFKSEFLEEMDRRQVKAEIAFPVSYEVWRNGKAMLNGDFRLSISFTIERFLGPEYLAIDFGTSAIAMAFAGEMDGLSMRGSGRSPAGLINLQHFYRENAEAGGDDDVETGSPFLSSMCLLFPSDDNRLGDPDFVRLPMHSGAVGQAWDLVIPYLKMLVGAGYTELPLPEEIEYRDWDGTRKEGRPALSGTLQSAFKRLERDYIQPYLQATGNQEVWDKLVITHPNTFTLKHVEVLKQVIETTFPDKDPIIFMSESDAAALYYLFRELAFRGGQEQDMPLQQHVLTYDIGAGTLDMTYLHVEREAGNYVPQHINYKAKVGIPIAGNHLDMLLARLVDRKLRAIEKAATAQSIAFEYRRKIVGVEESQSPREVYDFWTQIVLFKKDYTIKPSAEAILLNLGPVGPTAMISPGNLDGDAEFYKEQGVTQRPDEKGLDCYFLNLPRQEVETDPGIQRWMKFLTEDALEAVLSSVTVGQEKVPLDVVVVTGRTALWPDLKDRLIAQLRSRVESPESLFVPQIDAQEAKQAVVLGALVYAILWKDRVQFEDRNIWGRYGLVYSSQFGKREFRDLFSLDLTESETIQQGNRVVYLPRGEVSIDVGKTDNVSVVCSMAADPAKVLNNNAEDRMYSETLMIPVMPPIPRAFFEKAGQLTCHTQIDKEDQLHVRLQPDRGGIIELRSLKIVAGVPLSWPISPTVLPPEDF